MTFRILLASVVILCTADAQFTSNTNVEGSRCPSDHRMRCPSQESSCTDGVCSCNRPGDWGVPGLQCTAPEKRTCSITHNAQIRPFTAPGVAPLKIAVPCTSTLTAGLKSVIGEIPKQFIAAQNSSEPAEEDVQQSNTEKNQRSTVVNASCNYQIFSTNVRRKGVIYTSGFHVLIGFWASVPEFTLIKGVLFRANGRATKGNYTYTAEMSIDTAAPTKWNEVNESSLQQAGFTNATVTFELEKKTNRIVFKYPDCGLIINFRAHDIRFKEKQRYLPGLSVTLDDDNVIVDKGDSTLCVDVRKSFNDSLPGLTPESAFVVRSFFLTGLINLLVLDRPTDCTRAFIKSTSECNRINTTQSRSALNRCSKLLQNSTIINCVGHNANLTGANGEVREPIIHLYWLCVETECFTSTDDVNVNNRCRDFSMVLTGYGTKCNRMVRSVLTDSRCPHIRRTSS